MPVYRFCRQRRARTPDELQHVDSDGMVLEEVGRATAKDAASAAISLGLTGPEHDHLVCRRVFGASDSARMDKE